MIKQQDNSTFYVSFENYINKDRAQRVNYNNPMFRCMSHRDIYGSDIQFSIPEHWHEDFEYLVVLDGQLHYSVEGEQIILKKGEGILVNSKRIHSNYSPKGEYCLFCFVIIHPSYVASSPYIEEKYISPLLRRGVFDYLLLKRGTWTEQILDELLRMFNSPSDEAIELEIIETSYRVMRLLYLHYKSEFSEVQVNTTYDAAFRNMLTYLQEHYSERISLGDIAASGNIGKSLCTKLFRKYTAKTPGDYLINYRITKSMALLTSTDMEITEVAFAVGFSSNSHFTKTFREITGTTPLKYRSEGAIGEGRSQKNVVQNRQKR